MINESQTRTIEKIREYLKSKEGIQKLVKFEIHTHDMSPSYHYQRPFTLVQIFAEMNVPKEQRKNPFLEDSYHFTIGNNGGIINATLQHFGRRTKSIKKHIRIMVR